MSKPLCAQLYDHYLERYVSHGFGQVIGFQAVPVVEMFPQEHGHLQRNWGTAAALKDFNKNTANFQTLKRQSILHVRMVGIRAANMRNNMEKKRKPVLLNTLLASFPILR